MDEKVKAQREAADIIKGFSPSVLWVEENRKTIEDYMDFCISYPDLFLDFITPKESFINLFFYQRILLRASMRFRYVFGTFPRAYSKSFIAILSRFLQCVFLPNTKSFICADIKSTGVKIAREKIEEILNFWPLLRREILTIHQSNDYIELIFKNGSYFDVIGTTQGTRGIRRTSGVFEEAALLDADETNERVIPTLNISRKDVLGRTDPDEPVQSQIWITTAGAKATFAYEKLIEYAVMAVLHPETAYVCGGDYRLPVKVGLLNKSFIEDIKASSAYSVDSFAREYMSVWSGSSSESWIDVEKLARHRKLIKIEREASKDKVAKGDFYLMSVDVGRFAANTAVHVFRVAMRENNFQKFLVYTEAWGEMHFNDQACRIKHLYAKYLPREIVVDGTGVGAGLVDFLIIPTTDPATGLTVEGLGVINDEEYYKRQSPNIPQVIYVMKANATVNGEMHSNCFSQLMSGRISFLINDRDARGRLLSFKYGQRMTVVERKKFLLPYEMTSLLFEELGNLRLKPRANNVLDVEQISRRLLKDRFSALEMGLWRIKEYEDKFFRIKNRGTKNIADFLFYTPKAKDAKKPKPRRQRRFK